MKDNNYLKVKVSREIGAMSKREFADKCGISEGVVRKILRGEGAKDVTIEKISKYCGKPLWYFYPEHPNISPGPPILKKIPVISWVQAGEWSEVVDQFQPGYAEEWIDTTATNHPNAFALVVRGDSMEPEFTDGDVITVDPGREAISGSYIIAKNGDEATFKQLVIDGSSVFLKPLNPRYPIKDMTGVEFRIIGVVVFKGKGY